MTSARVAELIPDGAAYAAVYAALPEWRRRKCDALRFDADRRRSAAAWLLVERLLADRGLAASGLTVVENAFGRPEFAEPGSPRFSLSHTRDRVMAAVSDGPVGCDVETVRPVAEGVCELCLTDAELAVLAGVPEGSARERAFCRLWARKESRVKAEGCGLSADLRAFAVLDGDSGPWRFEDFDFGDGTLGCVCRPSSS